MKFLDYFTYRDRAGNRRLRRFTIATALLALVLLVIVGAALYNRSQVRAVAEATAKPVTVIPPTSTPTATPEPEPTAQPVSNTKTDECPSDPGEWAFVEYEAGQHLRRIEPACVYDDLARTVAWATSLTYGYTGPEAADALGFDAFEGESWPYRYEDVAAIPLEITTLSARGITVTNSFRAKRTARIRNNFTSILPEYRRWFVTDNGQAVQGYQTVLGCFRAADVESTGSSIEVDYWWSKYPAMCWVRSVSGAGHIAHRLGDIKSHFVISTTEGDVRIRNDLYGATTEGRWLLLGQDQDFKHTATAGEAESTVNVMATHHGLPLWDNDWFREQMGLSLQPLPDGWRQWPNRNSEIVKQGSALVEKRLTDAVSNEP